MSLTLHQHPLSSFCQKVLIALYENQTPFQSQLVNLGDASSRAAFFRLWPIGKMPVLRDDARGRTVPETSIIIEYLQLYYPGERALIPSEPERALEVRLSDRFYDLYVNVPTGKIVMDRLRPKAESDARGVADAKAQIEAAYGVIERDMATRTWATGESFSMADCAAAPALYYAERVVPLGERYPNVSAYARRLRERPSYARALREAEPYLHLFPAEDGARA
jgi:glutathione S-transferase